MSEKLNFFGDHGYTDYRKESNFQDVVENKKKFENLTFESFEKQINAIFSDYLSQTISKQNGRSQDDHMLLLSYFRNLADEHSFLELILSVVNPEYQTIKNSKTLIDKNTMFELIILFQSFVDIYTNDHQKINHRYLDYHNIKDHTPISYGLYHLLLSQNRINEGVDHQKITTQLFYTIRQFFSSFLANTFFSKSLEKQKQEKESSARFELIGTAEMYIGFLCLIIDTLEGKNREEYSQTIINVLDGKPRVLTDEEMVKLNETFEDIMTAYENDSMLNLNQFQNQVTSFIDYIFSDFKPNQSIQKTRHMLVVGKKLSFIPVSNFVFSQESDKLIDEEIEPTFGMQGKMLPRSLIMVKDANIFDAQGVKLWWGDISQNIDVSLLQGTYYILNQENGYFIDDETVVEGTIPDFKFDFFEREVYKFDQPTRVKMDYIKRKANYKIHDGKLIKNIVK